MVNLNIKNRYIGPCVNLNPSNSQPIFDISGFIFKLLLFDKFILQSNRLNEFTELVNAFGLGAVQDIFTSGVIKIHCEALAVGQTGQTVGFRGRKKDGTPKNLLPLNSFSFDIIKHVDKNKAIHDDLKKIHLIKGIKQKEAIKLKKLISDNLVWLPKDSFQIILSQLIADLRSNVLNVKKAVLYRIKENFGYEDISLDDIKLKVEVDDENDVHVVSNLTKFQVLDEVNVHEILGRGLLAIGGLNSRIETMRAFSALTGFKKKELQFFEDKLSFITKTIEPEEYEKRARNILSWPRFPDLSQAIFCKRLRIDKLLKIRESRDCFEFRQWLWSTDSIDDKELNEWLQSLGSKLSLSLVSKTGKTFRWLAITGLGYIPVIGKFLGPTASVLDTFLIERLLPNRGAVTFLGNVYPSIFKGE